MNRTLLKEEVVGNLVFGYTEMDYNDFEQFKKEGFKLRAHRGPLGRGLYARYKYHHGIFTGKKGTGDKAYGAATYGNVIVKFKASLSDGILVFEYPDAKIAYSSGYRLADQLVRFGIVASDDVLSVDSVMNQLNDEQLQSVLMQMQKSSLIPLEVESIRQGIQPDTFQAIMLSRVVDAVNNDTPLNAPYVKTMTDMLNSGAIKKQDVVDNHKLDTDSIAQKMLRIKKVGASVAGVLTYAGPPSIDGYVLFMNTPKLAIPVSYFSFDETGLKELGFDEGLSKSMSSGKSTAGLFNIRTASKNIKDYKIVIEESPGNWVWNLGRGKDVSFGILDLANLVNNGEVTFEKLSNAYLHSNSLWQGKGGYMFKTGDQSFKAAPFKDLDLFSLFSSLVTSGKTDIPEEVPFKKFSKQSRKSWIQSASARRKDITPDKRASEQNPGGGGWWKKDIEAIPKDEWAKASKDNPFYLNEAELRLLIRRLLK